MHAVRGVERLFCLKMLSHICDDDFAHVVPNPNLGNSLGKCINRSRPRAIEGGGSDWSAVPVSSRPQSARSSVVTLMVFERF